MSSMRKLERAESAAHAAYRQACADLVAAQVGTDLNEPTPEVERLRRRARAYRAQRDAASRRIEAAILSREAAS